MSNLNLRQDAGTERGTQREIGVDGPIREYYLVSPFDTEDESRHITEVGWPAFHTAYDQP